VDIVGVAKVIFGLCIIALPFAAGLQARPQDAVYLVSNWRLGVRALAALYVFVPAFIVAACLLANLDRPVNAALIVLSAAPMLPTLHFLLHKVGADHRYVVGLEVSAALASLVAIPAVFFVVSRLVPVVITLDMEHLVQDLLWKLLLPLVLGMVVFLLTSGRTADFGRKLTTIATIVLLCCGLVLFWSQREVLLQMLHWRLMVAIFVFVVFGTVTGHVLGGPDPGNRAALALAASGRNVGLSIAITHSVVHENFVAAAGTILLYAVARPLLLLPYVRAASARAPGPG